jgi:hypothetical protein
MEIDCLAWDRGQVVEKTGEEERGDSLASKLPFDPQGEDVGDGELELGIAKKVLVVSTQVVSVF